MTAAPSGACVQAGSLTANCRADIPKGHKVAVRPVASMIAFTTGRGSVFGGKPVPTLKLATNTEMYRRMEDDMDINCGVIVDGDATVDDLGKLIFDRIVETASGRPSKIEALGIGDSEFSPWDIGGVL